jgi:hypothetical protein
MTMFIRLDDAPSDGGSPASTPQNTPTTTPAPPGPTPAAPAAPPATKIVVEGELDERIVDLQAQLDETIQRLTRTEAEKKQRELDVAQLQDQLRAARQQPPPADRRSALEKFMAGEDV